MGLVYLVGAGPGDPGLLTVKAARVLRRAGILVYDALVNPAILDLAPGSAERIAVGKRGGRRCITQDEINGILIAAAGRTGTVVRLKGGDPFVFGRGGEEALAMRAAGVPFRVVPGVTAAVGAAAYAGVPLTHRGLASAVTLVTGHEAPGRTDAGVDWDRFGAADATIVVYMGVARLREIAARLLAAGRAPNTPAAVIEWGTYRDQRTVTAPLLALADEAERAGLRAPAVIVVGEVVSLRDELAWFDRPEATRRSAAKAVPAPSSGASRLARPPRSPRVDAAFP